ncbi:MAG: NAD-dependent deacylase [Planctomycetota bacterium]
MIVRHLVVLTGAGISADSGVQTFRDAGGLWEGHRPEDVATPQAWQRDRALVWRFYQGRRAQLPSVQPNAAHQALAALERRLLAAGHAFTLITQNVDDLHDRAGHREVLHMHGELASLRCESCGHTRRDLSFLDAERCMPCPSCGHDALRPDIVWFGEIPFHLDRIDRAIASCTHFVAIGTSGVVWPAAGLLHAARELGAQVWVQALEEPANLVDGDRFVRGRAADVVPAMLDEIGASMLV